MRLTSALLRGGRRRARPLLALRRPLRQGPLQRGLGGRQPRPVPRLPRPRPGRLCGRSAKLRQGKIAPDRPTTAIERTAMNNLHSLLERPPADPPRLPLPLRHGHGLARPRRPPGVAGPRVRRRNRRRRRWPPRRRRCPAKAKRVIHLFMNGGPSHVDTFDPKPMLDEVRRQAAAAPNLPHRAQDRRGLPLAVQVPEVRPERHRGQRAVRRTPPSASTTSASSARCTPTCPTTSRR